MPATSSKSRVEARPLEVGLEHHLFEASQVELVGPGAAVLHVERPVGVRKRIRVQHAGFALFLSEPGESLAQLIAVDQSLDHDVPHVKTERPERTGHPLGEGAETGLLGGVEEPRDVTRTEPAAGAGC